MLTAGSERRMLRTRSGAPLIVDDRLRLLLLIPAVLAVALVLDWLVASPPLFTGAPEPVGSDALAAGAVLAPPLPPLERTVLRRPEEYSNGTILRAVPTPLKWSFHLATLTPYSHSSQGLVRRTRCQVLCLSMV